MSHHFVVFVPRANQHTAAAPANLVSVKIDENVDREQTLSRMKKGETCIL